MTYAVASDLLALGDDRRAIFKILNSEFENPAKDKDMQNMRKEPKATLYHLQDFITMDKSRWYEM